MSPQERSGWDINIDAFLLLLVIQRIFCYYIRDVSKIRNFHRDYVNEEKLIIFETTLKNNQKMFAHFDGIYVSVFM